MAKRKPTLPVIHDTSATLPRLDPDQVEKALGGKAARQKLEKQFGPMSLVTVREELLRRLQSTGGRPALTETDRRVKIPLNDQQWLQLEELAATFANTDFSPSAGHVASVLLALSLQAIAHPASKRGQPGTRVNSARPKG